MTVCVAATASGMVFLASDRMLTTGDVEFEPRFQGAKIYRLTNAIACMFSGDASFHAEILQATFLEMKPRLENNPDEWFTVKEVAEIYLRRRLAEKSKQAERLVLMPLGLTLRSFRETSDSVVSQLAANIADQIVNFELPYVEVIMAGIDKRHGNPSPSIYVIKGDEIACFDSMAFAAIGTGARHAESAFMLARHAPNAGATHTLMLTYSAKRDAEVAPGVGGETDLVVLGPQAGQGAWIDGEWLGRLKKEDDKVRKATAKAKSAADAAMGKYIENLRNQNAETQKHESGSEEDNAADAS